MKKLTPHEKKFTGCIPMHDLPALNADAQFAYNNAFPIGNIADDRGYSMTADAFGNYYCTGFYNGWLDIDPGIGSQYLTSKGGQDIYVAKYSPAGYLVWAFTIGGSGNDEAFKIKLDANNNIYITGRFRDTVDFDPGTGTAEYISNGELDIFLAKYEINGNFLWANAMGGSGDDEGCDVAVDPTSGNTVITGNFNSLSVDMDPGVGTQLINNNGNPGLGFGNLFVAAYSCSNGACQWSFGIGGTDGTSAGRVTTDNSGNILICGNFAGANVDFDPAGGTQNLNSLGSADFFVAKYNNNGSLQWANSIGGPYGEIGYALACDNNGNVFTGGYFNSDSVDFDPGTGTHFLSTNGVQDLFVEKLNSSGQFQWVFTLGGVNSEVVQDLALDNAGDVFITGSFGNTIDFDPGNGVHNLIGFSNIDGYLAQYNSDGNFVDAIPFAGNGYEFGVGLCVIPPNKVGVTGYFSTDTLDFNPGAGVNNLVNMGGNIMWSDAFVATYTYSPTGINEFLSDRNAMAAYPNPSDGNFQVVFNSEKQIAAILELFSITGVKISASDLNVYAGLNRVLFKECDLNHGIYFVKINAGNNLYSQKIIIEK